MAYVKIKAADGYPDRNHLEELDFLADGSS